MLVTLLLMTTLLAPHPLTTLLAERISSGLQRATIRSCSAWSETYRVMGEPFPGKWTFRHHPWLRQMHNDESDMIAGQKAAQMGFTELGLNKTFFAIDVKGQSVLYVLPANTPDAGDFSSSRFDPALELSPHLQHLFSHVKNIGHKRAGNSNLFIRGSRSRSQLKSIPTALVILDEIDEMNQANVPLAFERSAGQIAKQALLISTPTIARHGIHLYFEASTKHQYVFKCPHCSRYTELIFPECLVITADNYETQKIKESHLQCKECHHALDHAAKSTWLGPDNAKWVPTYTDRLITGYHINQLYSMVLPPYEIAIKHLQGLINPADEQELYNSKLGLVHEAEGARVTDSNIHECTGSHTKVTSYNGGNLVTIGIDVGKWLHYEVVEWFLGDMSTRTTNDISLLATSRLLMEGKVLQFEELDALLTQFKVRFAVIDANPERRKALEFAQRFYGHTRLCFYGTGITGKAIHLHDAAEHTMTVDRTSWMDVSLGRFRSHKIVLPKDLSTEYKAHIKAPVRVYEKDALGNPIGKYVKADKDDDHFAHAHTYAEIALLLASTLGQHQTVDSVI